MQLPRLRPIHVLIGIVFFTASCARMCGKMAYDNHIRRATSHFVFEGFSDDAIWREAGTILRNLGHDPDIAVPPVEETYLTPWDGEPGNRERIAVRILEIDKQTHRLQVHRIREYQETIYPPGYDPYDPNARPLDPSELRMETRRSRDRDLYIEWDVIQRVDPNSALLIEGEAMRRQDTTQEVVANGCQ